MEQNNNRLHSSDQKSVSNDTKSDNSDLNKRKSPNGKFLKKSKRIHMSDTRTRDINIFKKRKIMQKKMKIIQNSIAKKPSVNSMIVQTDVIPSTSSMVQTDSIHLTNNESQTDVMMALQVDEFFKTLPTNVTGSKTILNRIHELIGGESFLALKKLFTQEPEEIIPQRFPQKTARKRTHHKANEIQSLLQDIESSFIKDDVKKIQDEHQKRRHKSVKEVESDQEYDKLYDDACSTSDEEVLSEKIRKSISNHSTPSTKDHKPEEESEDCTMKMKEFSIILTKLDNEKLNLTNFYDEVDLDDLREYERQNKDSNLSEISEVDVKPVMIDSVLAPSFSFDGIIEIDDDEEDLLREIEDQEWAECLKFLTIYNLSYAVNPYVRKNHYRCGGETFKCDFESCDEKHFEYHIQRHTLEKWTGFCKLCDRSYGPITSLNEEFKHMQEYHIHRTKCSSPTVDPKYIRKRRYSCKKPRRKSSSVIINGVLSSFFEPEIEIPLDESPTVQLKSEITISKPTIQEYQLDQTKETPPEPVQSRIRIRNISELQSSEPQNLLISTTPIIDNSPQKVIYSQIPTIQQMNFRSQNPHLLQHLQQRQPTTLILPRTQVPFNNIRQTPPTQLRLNYRLIQPAASVPVSTVNNQATPQNNISLLEMHLLNPNIPTPSSTQSPHQVQIRLPNIANSQILKLSVQPWILDGNKCNKDNLTSFNMLNSQCLKNRFKCMGRSCAFTIDTANEFHYHLAVSHININIIDDEENILKCAYCSHKSTAPEHLIEHILNYHQFQRFACTKCFYRAVSESHMHIHYQMFHYTESSTEDVGKYYVIDNLPQVNIVIMYQNMKNHIYRTIKPIDCPGKLFPCDYFIRIY